MRWLAGAVLGRPAGRDDSDAALLGRYLAGGDEAAFARLVARHTPLVYRVCYGVLADRHHAEDAAQATFLLLARKARSIRRRESAASWLHGTALRTARCLRTRLVRARRRDAARPPLPPAPSGFDELSVKEARAVLHAELDRLPERYKAPLVLVYFDDLSHTEAARELGWTEAVFRGRLERGRTALGRRLARHKLSLTVTLAAATLAVPVPAAVAGPASPVAVGLAAEAGRGSGVAAAAAVAATVAVAAGVAVGPVRSIPAQPMALVAPAVGYDRGLILTAADDQLHLLPPGGGPPLAVSPPLGRGGPVSRLRVAPDGRAAAFEHAFAGRACLHVWRYDRAWPGDDVLTTGAVTFFWLPDGGLVVAHRDKPARVLDVRTGEERSLAVPPDRLPVDVGPNGVLLLFADRALTLGPDTVADGLGEAEAIRWRLAPDGRTAAGPTPSGVRVWSGTTGLTAVGGPGDEFLAWAPGGRAVLLANDGGLAVVPADGGAGVALTAERPVSADWQP